MVSRENNFISTIRSFPDSIKFVSLINFIGNPSVKNLFYVLLFLTGSLTNFTLKNIFKLIYNKSNVKTLPLFGIGQRPKGASSCSAYLTFDNKLSKSFGMPSGHSQMAWIFSSFFIFKILRIFKKNKDSENDENDENENKYNKNNPFYQNSDTATKSIIKIFQILLLLTFAIFMSYSRVAIEKCHTVQQVVVGGIVGIIIGLIGYYVYFYLKL